MESMLAYENKCLLYERVPALPFHQQSFKRFYDSG